MEVGEVGLPFGGGVDGDGVAEGTELFWWWVVG